MFGPICKYSPMTPSAKKAMAQQRSLGVEYAPLNPGEQHPDENACWYKASKQLEMSARSNTHQVHVACGQGQALKYVYKSGTIEQDGFCVYSHCRNKAPDLYFKYINKKLVVLEQVEVTADNKLRCKIVGALSGEEICPVELSPRKTVAHAKKHIEQLMRDNDLVIGQSVIEVQNFADVHPSVKLKTVLSSPQSAGKRLKSKP